MKKPLDNYRWQNWYLGGTLQVLRLISSMWGVQTRAAQHEVEQVRRRLTAAYKREKGRR